MVIAKVATFHVATTYRQFSRLVSSQPTSTSDEGTVILFSEAMSRQTAYSLPHTQRSLKQHGDTMMRVQGLATSGTTEEKRPTTLLV